MTLYCQKYHSNLTPIWFSRSTLSFLEDFALDDNEKPLRDWRDFWRFGELKIFERGTLELLPKAIILLWTF